MIWHERPALEMAAPMRSSFRGSLQPSASSKMTGAPPSVATMDAQASRLIIPSCSFAPVLSSAKSSVTPCNVRREMLRSSASSTPRDGTEHQATERFDALPERGDVTVMRLGPSSGERFEQELGRGGASLQLLMGDSEVSKLGFGHVELGGQAFLAQERQLRPELAHPSLIVVQFARQPCPHGAGIAE